MAYNDFLMIASKKIISSKQMEEIEAKINEIIEADILTLI